MADKLTETVEMIRLQARRVRNYSNPDEVFEAVPLRLIESDCEDALTPAGEDEAIFTIHVKPEWTSIHTQAGKRIEPDKALGAAIKALSGERSDAAKCPAHVAALSRPNVDEMREALSDPNAVHVNLLRGTIARPSVEQIIHIYRPEVLRAALNGSGNHG